MRSLCRHIKRFAGGYKDKVYSACLFRFDEPVSPHLAARLAEDKNKTKVCPRYDSFPVTN